MVALARWGIAIAFFGAVIGVCVQFHALSPEQRRRYKKWFQASIILLGIGILIQLITMSV